jgi:hypothetical protein
MVGYSNCAPAPWRPAALDGARHVAAVRGQGCSGGGAGREKWLWTSFYVQQRLTARGTQLLGGGRGAAAAARGRKKGFGFPIHLSGALTCSLAWCFLGCGDGREQGCPGTLPGLTPAFFRMSRWAMARTLMRLRGRVRVDGDGRINDHRRRLHGDFGSSDGTRREDTQ